MNKRRRYKVKRRRAALQQAWKHCRLFQAVLRHEGLRGVVIRPMPRAVQAALDRMVGK